MPAPLVRKRRELTAKSIALNPMEVVLNRVMRVDDGAGGHKRESVDLPPQTMRLYIGNRSSRDVAEVGGVMQFNEWGLLAAHDADLQKGDTFNVDGKKHRIEKVDPVALLGEVVSIQATVVEVV